MVAQVMRASAPPSLRRWYHAARTLFAPASRDLAWSEDDRRLLAALPELRRFVEDVRFLATSGSQRQFARCRGPFERLLRGDVLQRLVDYELAAAARGETLRRQVGHERKLAIFDAGAFALEAWFLPPTDDDDPIVATVTRSILVGVAGRAPIALRRYRRPAGGRRDVFDPNRRLVDLGVQTLAPGNVAVFRPGVDAFAVVAEPVDRLALVFETRHLEPLRWHYDRRSLRPIRATPTDVSWTRLQETLRLIAALGERTLLPRVIALYAHPSHFVRWSAVQTALALAPEEGRALLRRACRDRHPQLREAARRLWR